MLLQMNFFEYLNQDGTSKTFVEDAANAAKAPQKKEQTIKRLHRATMLIGFVPKEKARKIIEDNVALIKTIPGEDEHRRIVWYLLRVFYGIYSRDELVAYLMKMGGVDEDRAMMIADDQIHKAAERFLVEKWKGQGCKRVRWVHEGRTNPRQYHLRQWNGKSGKRNGRPNGLNGYEFDIDKPPVINLKTKERGYPGQMINCHCRLVPIWK